MIGPGDEIENPVTGERLVFRKTSAETAGAAVVVETFLRPYATGTRTHLHPAQEERFEILDGSVGIQFGKQRLVAGPGHRLTVTAGTAHRLWNAGEEPSRYLSEIRPALQFEQLATTLFELAAATRTRNRAPNLLRLAVVAQAYFGTAQLPTPPHRVQRLGLALTAPLGRLFGYPPFYSHHLSQEEPQ
jgi:mannose-6-phosphate isomerase-like protein (cupin superfamily)